MTLFNLKSESDHFRTEASRCHREEANGPKEIEEKEDGEKDDIWSKRYDQREGSTAERR